MKNQTISPEIVSLAWGSVKTGDGNRYKDVKLYPGGSRAWDWNETGTRHTPGIQPADVRELLEHDAKTVILSRGINERLQVCPETEEYLKEHNVAYHILQTEQAVERYNELREREAVGALIHSTC